MARGKSGLDPTRKLLTQFIAKFGPQSQQVRRVMLANGRVCANEVVAGMNAGRDIRGNPFRRYSEKYLEVRRGERPYAYAGGKPLFTRVPNPERVILALRGLYQAGIQPRMTSNTQFEVGGGAGGIFPDHFELGRFHDQGRGVPKREHLGFTQSMRDKMMKVTQAEIARAMKEAEVASANG